MDDDQSGTPSYSERVVKGRLIDVAHWPTPDEGALTGATLQQYLARKNAVTLYLRGTPLEEIERVTGVSGKQAYRLIFERCLEEHADGQPYGWRGLIPYSRVRSYKRKRAVRVDQFGHGGAGAMETVLDRYPHVRTAFERRVRKSSEGKNLGETNIRYRGHWIWFLDELRKSGCESRDEWPFNTESQGYYSVRRHVIRILECDAKALAFASGGPEAVRKLKTGDGSGRPITKFLQRVEMDAHKLDGRFCISVPEIGGGTKERIVYRLWVICMIDVVTRVVLGYYFCTGKEPSAEDVLRCIKSALIKWRPKQISYSNEPYEKGAGLLSSLGDDFVGLCWDETSVDGAKSLTCQGVRDALKNIVGSTLICPQDSFSKRHSPDDRPFIEVFFRNLAGKGFQRMSNTTGAKAADKKGRAPEEIALTSRFQYEYAEELLDVIIANYNIRPHGGIGRRIPLAYAKLLYAQTQHAARRATPTAIDSFLSVRKLCNVRGGAKVGRAAFVECNYAEYSNEILQNRQDLVGQKIWVIHHLEDDARIALASTQDGTSLGVLRARPPWQELPHSLSIRRAICRAEATGKFRIPPGGDAISTFIQYVESQPGRKLPIHPAYLAARRILAQAADPFVGETLLQAAHESAAFDVSTAPVSSQSSESPVVHPTTERKQEQAGAFKASNPSKPLPARRMAAVKR